MTASVRAFVALLPTDEAVAHLDDFLEVRRAAADLRWTPPGLWHVTLAFAASVPAGRLDELDDLLAAAALRRPAFGMRVRGGGAFPHPDAARVLHAGLAPDGGDGAGRDGREEGDDGADVLGGLSASTRAALSRVGARVDGRRFRPHLTLARLARPANVTSWVRLLDAYEGPRWQVRELALVVSHLGEGPHRTPRHEVVAVHPLG